MKKEFKKYYGNIMQNNKRQITLKQNDTTCINRCFEIINITLREIYVSSQCKVEKNTCFRQSSSFLQKCPKSTMKIIHEET